MKFTGIWNGDNITTVDLVYTYAVNNMILRLCIYVYIYIYIYIQEHKALIDNQAIRGLHARSVWFGWVKTSLIASNVEYIQAVGDKGLL